MLFIGILKLSLPSSVSVTNLFGSFQLLIPNNFMISFGTPIIANGLCHSKCNYMQIELDLETLALTYPIDRQFVQVFMILN